MIPLSVKLNANKKSLQITYKNEKFLIVSSAFLRACSPSAENKKNTKNPNRNLYRNISIKRIESVGNYAIRLVFSDGHNTGIYSWEYLFQVGTMFQNSSDP